MTASINVRISDDGLFPDITKVRIYTVIVHVDGKYEAVFFRNFQVAGAVCVEVGGIMYCANPLPKVESELTDEQRRILRESARFYTKLDFLIAFEGRSFRCCSLDFTPTDVHNLLPTPRLGDA